MDVHSIEGSGDIQTRFLQDVDRMVDNIDTVIMGKTAEVRRVVNCFLAEGHLLVEDVPGTGKTSLAHALAGSIGLESTRIQFTPDLLPSDITGVSIFNQATREFEFKHGPVFANIVLGDEINRASPKTQSALLEVMEEGTVSTDAMIFPVPKPFMVIATQNPLDMEGTYKLPEAQLDRFMMRVSVGYPDSKAEELMLQRHGQGSVLKQLKSVVSAANVAGMMTYVRNVEVSPSVHSFIVSITAATRESPEVRLGVSPRGSLSLLRASKAAAAMEGRTYVTPDDVKFVAKDVLTHRIIVLPSAEMKGFSASVLVDRVLQNTPVPRISGS
ncbi:MAG: AAA family ATPase [Ferrimicrobium sp.]